MKNKLGIVFLIMMIGMQSHGVKKVIIDYTHTGNDTLDKLIDISGLSDEVKNAPSPAAPGWGIFYSPDFVNPVSHCEAKMIADEVTHIRVMAVSLDFTGSPAGSYAVLRPPFAVQSLPSDMDMEPLAGFGLVYNVGVIKSFSIKLTSNRYKSTLGLLLTDEEGRDRIYYFGSLDFEDRRELIWTNPSYIEEVRNHYLNRNAPVPEQKPALILKGIIIEAEPDETTIDLLIENITCTYDYAYF